MLRDMIPLLIDELTDNRAVDLSTQHKGSYGMDCAEEGFISATVATAVREYAETMEAGARPKPIGVTTRPDGQQVVHVGPQGVVENMVFPGARHELWLKPGAASPPTQGKVYRAAEQGSPINGGVSCVLGAGNQWVICVLDALHVLLAENRVAVIKMNPVNEHMGPACRRMLKPFVERGFVEFVYGGAEQGIHLTGHEGVDAIHMTGSGATYDAIMWGGTEAKLKSGAKLKCDKVVTAELGCVTPWIITPGEWSDDAIEYHARNVVSLMVNNSSHNCNATKVLVTSAAWDKRSQFLDTVRRILSEARPRVAYYPGAEANYRKYMAAYPDAEIVGAKPADAKGPVVPWTFKTGLSADDVEAGINDTCCTFEPWCGVLSEVTVPADPAAGDDADAQIKAFLPRAVKLVNERCYGNLSASLIVPPSTMKRHPKEFDDAVAGMKYGSVVVNGPSPLAFAISRTSWGAFPGNDSKDVQSGVGYVHNTMLYDEPEKGVLYLPWTESKTTFWDHDPPNAGGLWLPTLNLLGKKELFSGNTVDAVRKLLMN